MTTITETTPGTYYWTVPAGVNSLYAQCWGGGGGGNCRDGSEPGGGGGGGGGGYGERTFTVHQGDIVTYVVGSGGYNTDDIFYADGTASSVTYQTTTQALGDYGDTSYGTFFTGRGGTDNVGSVVHDGGDGYYPSPLIPETWGGGGGSSAGTGGDGNDATGQSGASAPTNGGPGGDGGNTRKDGSPPASGPGGGGGGAGTLKSGVGGDGYSGQVKLTWTDPVNVVRCVVTNSS